MRNRSDKSREIRILCPHGGTVRTRRARRAPEAVPAGIALVVGLHFFPLARLYDQWQYRWTA
ncbi:hypothetical protein ABT116_35855, partial [Streptomyces sp. NPDC002130]